jgi:hypothetical protein
MNATDALEASLESMRLMEEPISMQLLNRNARRPKKVGTVLYKIMHSVLYTDDVICYIRQTMVNVLVLISEEDKNALAKRNKSNTSNGFYR